MKNPHKNNSPEWQLFEQWKTYALLVRSANDYIRHAEERRNEAIKQRDAYADVLDRLGHSVDKE